MRPSFVSVIVLNWNGNGYAEECLSSVLRQDCLNFELIVVDNGSKDASLEAIRNKFYNKIILIENKKNVGFAAGNNTGIRRAKGEYVALLNNDAVAKSDWITEQIKAIEGDEKIGMCASKVLNYFERDIIDTAGHLIYRDGLNRGRGRLEKDTGQYDNPEEVFFPSGAACLYRKKMLDEIGLFDEDFFAYGEDADIGIRAQLAGWKCVYAPKAVVYHRYSASSSAYSPLKAFYVERNRSWVALKNFPLTVLLLSPFYAFKRYLWQACGVIFRKGAAGKFAARYSPIRLLWILLKANVSAAGKIFIMCKKRRRIKELTRVSREEILSWFKRYGITAREISLRD